MFKRGVWTAIEDKILIDYINAHGEGKWRTLPKEAGLRRCGKSCRLRWLNYLRPGIRGVNISCNEEDLIIRLHKLLGNSWSLIAGRLPGRTDNEIKNYWNTVLSKRVQVKELDHSTTKYKDGKKQSKSAASSGVIYAKAKRCTKVFMITPQQQHQIINENNDVHKSLFIEAKSVHETSPGVVESESSDRSFSLLSSTSTNEENPSSPKFTAMNFGSDFDFCDMNSSLIYDYGTKDCSQGQALLSPQKGGLDDCVELEANNFDADFGFLAAFLDTNIEDSAI